MRVKNSFAEYTPVPMLAGDPRELWRSRAGADGHRVKSFFAHQFVDGDCPAQHDVRFKLHAHVPQIVQLFADNLLWQAKLRNAVDQHAAKFMKRLNHADLVPPLSQVTCHSQPDSPLPATATFFPIGGTFGKWRIPMRCS